jgi:hypothetical protein
MIRPDAAPLVFPPTLLQNDTLSDQLDSCLDIDKAAKPVLNAGIGISQAIFKDITLLPGANTDYSSYENIRPTNRLLFGTGNWNLYHISTGLSYRKKEHLLAAGIPYAIAPSKDMPPSAIINNKTRQTGKARISSKTTHLYWGIPATLTKIERKAFSFQSI